MTSPRITKRFTLGTDLSALEALETGLSELKTSCHLSERNHYQIRLALDELVTNVVSYGFSGGVGSAIVIDIAIVPGDVCEISYSDDAPPFNPVEHCVPNSVTKSASHNFGGLGIFLVKEIMDEVTYHYKNGRNLLNMKKRLAE